MGSMFSPMNGFQGTRFSSLLLACSYRSMWLLAGAWPMLPVPLLGSARNAHVDPLCVPFLEELRQRGLHEWLASLSFDNPDCPDLQLTMGAVIVEEMRVAVEAATGFRCSAGISHNKVRL